METRQGNVQHWSACPESIINFLAFPLCVIDANSYRIIAANAAAYRMGFTEDSNCFSVFCRRETPSGATEHCCVVDEVRRTRAPFTVEHLYHDEGGQTKPFEVHAHPVFDNEGNVARIIIYSFDVSGRKVSEERLKSYEFIVNTAKEFMSFINRNYVYEAVNETYCSAHSRKREDLIGRTIAEVWGEEKFKKTIKRYLDECFAGRETRYEAWFEFPSLGKGYFNVTYYPYRDSAGNVTHAVVVSHDITKRKLAEEALRLSEEKFSKAFRFSPDNIAITTLSEGRYLDVNEAFLRFTGYTRDQVSGHTSLELGIWVDPGQRDEMVKILQERGEVSSQEVKFRNKDGDVRTVLWSAEIISFAGEQCLIAITRDITERKQAEEALRVEASSLKQYLLDNRLDHEEAFRAIITRNKKMRAIFQYVEVIAGTREPVLITGETGVGKELFARVIHHLSGCKGQFVAVNVAGLDDVVFSDTLFGHKRGAYTGADQTRQGLIARASAGTLFLDEIGDLAESSQVKLLRLLQEHTYYPLGSDTPSCSDVRIVVATNQDIQELIANGKFRKDLYYRLRAHQVHIPPLRERKDDLPLLLEHFLDEASAGAEKRRPVQTPDLLLLLTAYDYPGNVRELRAMVFDAVTRHKAGKSLIESFSEFIGENIAPAPQGAAPSDENIDELSRIFGRFPTLKETEELLIGEALKRANRHQGVAASMLGITRQALNKRLLRTPKLRTP